MRGFTSFLKDPPLETGSSWFFGKKQTEQDDYVVTTRAGTWDDILERDASALEAERGEHNDYTLSLEAHTKNPQESPFQHAPIDPQLRERWRRHQRSKMKDWWVADKMAKQCYECRSNFSVLTRKHHCRVCGQIFCHKCSDNFLPGHRLGFAQDSVRLCQCCHAVWQPDKMGMEAGTAAAGPLSMKAQGIARQVSMLATRQRAISDTRTNPAPVSPAQRFPTPVMEALPRVPSAVTLKAPNSAITPKTNTFELDHLEREPSRGLSPSKALTKSLSNLQDLCDDAVSTTTAPIKEAPGSTWRPDFWDNAECTFLTTCIGVDTTKAAQWRNKVQRLVDDRLADPAPPPLDCPFRDDSKLMCLVGNLPDAPSLFDSDPDDVSTASDDGERLMDDQEARTSLESAAHNHLRHLVYRMLGDLIITGTDIRGMLPEDDRLDHIQQHLIPIIRRAVYAAPLAAKPPFQKRQQSTRGLPDLTYRRDMHIVDPPKDSESYAHNAAAAISGALFGLEIASMHDLDVAVVEAVRCRPNNMPESLVCLLLSNPMMTTIAGPNENVAFARHVENTFITAFPDEFVLGEGVTWLQQQYDITEEEGLECIELLYKRGAIISDPPEATDQLARSYRDRMGVLHFGGPLSKERVVLDRRRVYHILRAPTVVEVDNTTGANITAMLEAFRNDFKKDDMRGIDQIEWTKVICRLAWKAATTILPCVWKDKDDVMDIRHYMKVIPIEGGEARDCEYVRGTAIKGTVAHREMPTEVWNPRILLLSDQIDYERTSVRTDFSTLVQGTQLVSEEATPNDGTWLEQLSSRVEVMRPSVVLVEKSVNLRVQDNLCSSGISLVTSVSQGCLKRAKRATRADIVNQLTRIPIHYLQAAGQDDESVKGAPRLGCCALFKACKVGGVPLLYLCGGDDEKGCAIILRGASKAVLKRLKVIVKFAAYMAHNLLLETHYLDDANACLNEPQYDHMPSVPSAVHTSLDDSPVSASSAAEEASKLLGDFSAIRDSTELLSASLCVDFELPEELASRGKRGKEKEKERELLQQLQQQLQQPDGSPVGLAVKSPSVFLPSEMDGDETASLSASTSLLSTVPVMRDAGEVVEQSPGVVAQRRRNRLVQLCHELCYLNPLFHQSIMVHDTITEINVDTERSHGEERARSASVLEGTVSSVPSIDRRASVVQTERKQSTCAPVPVSTKDLVNQAHKLGFGIDHKEAADEMASQLADAKNGVETRHETLRMPGGTANFKKLLIEYYKIGKSKGSDIPLVFYLAEHFSQASSATNTVILTRQYAHHQGRLTVTSEKTDEVFSCDYVIMWAYCKKCEADVSPPVELSPYTLSYSFGKFLETSFYNFKAASRKCGHCLHGDLVRYFGQRVVVDDGKGVNVQVKFDYQPVQVYKLKFPELECYYDATKFNAFVDSEHQELLEAIHQGYTSVKEGVDDLERYFRDNSYDDAEEVLSLRQRIMKECTAMQESTNALASAVPYGASTVTEFNKLRKVLHTALQGWLKELNEKANCAPFEDRSKEKGGRKWKPRFGRDDTGRPLHHTTSSFDAGELVTSEAFRESDFPQMDTDVSVAVSVPASPKSPTMASLATLPQLPLQTAPQREPTLPQAVHRRSFDAGSLPSPRGHSPEEQTDSTKSPSNDISRVTSPQPPAHDSAPPYPHGESPQPRSPVPGNNLRLSQSEVVDFDTPLSLSNQAASLQSIPTPSGSLQSRRPTLQGGTTFSSSKSLHPPKGDTLIIKLPPSIGGPGVLMNLATGVDGMTVIVRLEEPTSMIAHTLCCSQHRRACQPSTPPLSPAAGPRRIGRGHSSPSTRPEMPQQAAPTPPDTPETIPTAERRPSSAGPDRLAAAYAGNGSAANTPTPGQQAPSSASGSVPMPGGSTCVSPVAEEAGGLPVMGSAVLEASDVESVVGGRSRARGFQFEPGPDSLGGSGSVSGAKRSRQGEIDALSDVLGEKMRRVEIKEFEEMNSWSDGAKGKQQPTLRFACIVFCARQFAALRQYYCKGDESNLLASLSRCHTFAPTGGKTGASYYKTLDDRFVLKAIKQEELQHFENKMAKKYFEYMARAIKSRMPTLLVKILGVFKITVVKRDGREVTNNWMLMENLFYNRKVDRMFDLKGLMRNRFQPNQDAVLLDENLLRLVRDGKWVFTTEESKETLNMGVHNDTLMLRRNDIMDYSLLLGLDDEKREIYVGIIDYMREYDMKKQLEFFAKSTVAGRGQQPTVVDPNKYKERFRAAMNNYFLMLPGKATPWVIKHKKYQTLTGPGSELVFA